MTVTINGTTGIAGVDGSAGTPAVQGSDTNTGIVFPAADAVAIATGGVEAVRVNGSGNVGIGTSSPSNFGASFKTLQVDGSSYGLVQASSGAVIAEMMGSSASSTGFVGTRSNHPFVLRTNDTERVRIDSSGNVGIGTSSPISNGSYSTLTVGNGTGGILELAVSGSRYGRIYADTSVCSVGSFASIPLLFKTGDTERARIDSSGNLLVGTTTSSGNGNLIAAGVYNNTTASGANVQVDNTGPGLLRRSTSSIVYKTDVEPIEASYIDNALKFQPVWYRSLCEGDRKDWSWYGLIAEEVGAIDPRLVHWRMLDTSVDENGQTVQTPLEKPVAEGVMYDRVVVLALGLIQKQQGALQELKAELDTVKAELAAMKG